MPFTSAQIRAIAADRNRRYGDAGPYLHNLKRKTLKHKEQWGGASPVKKSSRFGGTDWSGERIDEFSKSRNRFNPEAERQRRLGAYTALTGAGSVGALGYGGKRMFEETKNARKVATGRTKYLTASGGRTKGLVAVGLGGLYGTNRLRRYSRGAANEAWT